MAKFAFLQLALAAATAAAASVPAAPQARDTDAEAVADAKLGFISMPLERREHGNAVLHRRDNDVPLYNMSSVSYLIELKIGTPGQAVKVAIDTGSDELWVNPQCETSGSVEQEASCREHGRYFPSRSSTSTETKVESYIPYGKGEVQMEYVIDNITLTDSTLAISQQIFGVAIASNELNEGILGLSYGLNVNLEYPNFVDSLFLQDATNTRAFSIALGSKDFDNGGTLIFGGVDTKKFTGDLKSATILGPQGGERMNRYWVNMTGLSYSNGGSPEKYSTGTIPVVLDSGSTLSYLPASVVNAIATDLKGQFDRQSGLWIVDCSAAKTSNTMDFSFSGGITIKVPMYEFIWEAVDDICVLGAVGIDSSGGIPLLGDSMMRAGYFVFDQENNAIHMAQYANCGENEQAIPRGGSATSFSGECTNDDVEDIINGVATANTGSGGNGGSGTGTSGSSSDGEDNGVGALAGNLGVVFSLAAVVAFSML